MLVQIDPFDYETDLAEQRSMRVEAEVRLEMLRRDLEHANRAIYDLAEGSDGKVCAYVVVNPNYQEHAIDLIEQGRSCGAIGVKLAASRRAT